MYILRTINFALISYALLTIETKEEEYNVNISMTGTRQLSTPSLHKSRFKELKKITRVSFVVLKSFFISQANAPDSSIFLIFAIFAIKSKEVVRNNLLRDINYFIKFLFS